MTRIPESEDDFQRFVIETAKLNGWKVTHFRPVKLLSGRWATPLQGDAGFPDLALARGGVVILAELKSQKGIVSDDQESWLAAIGSELGRVWRPSDRPAIVAELSRSAAKRRQVAGL
jgi:hypothetical protein